MSVHRAGPPESSLRISIVARRQNRNLDMVLDPRSLRKWVLPGEFGQVADIESGVLRR
jgi:hypothetical protein